MNTKRLARTALAVIVTVGIVVAIIVGCGPKWGNGTATGKTGFSSFCFFIAVLRTSEKCGYIRRVILTFFGEYCNTKGAEGRNYFPLIF